MFVILANRMTFPYTSFGTSSSSLDATTSAKFWPSQGIFSIWGGF
jgi:hypothetical protein